MGYESTLERLWQAGSEEAGEAFRQEMRRLALEAWLEIARAEVEALCGARYGRGRKGPHRRSGSAPGSIRLGGRREEVRRPRVRRGEQEVKLRSYAAARDGGDIEARMMRALLCGVSCRGQGRLAPEELRGRSKSQISRLWAEEGARRLELLQKRDLSGWKFFCLMMDGVELAKDLTALVALGVAVDGQKVVLGFRQAGSENAEAAKDLIDDITRRGFAIGERRLLAVLDGSEALENAVMSRFDEPVLQRCLVHKERNLRSYLPRRDHGELAGHFKRLRRAQGEGNAREALAELETFLRKRNHAALQSLHEAGDKLIALQSLGVPATLNVSLLSTNLIENTLRNLRRVLGRVTRFRKNTRQPSLWLAAGLLWAEEGFRRIQGAGDIPALLEALIKKPPPQTPCGVLTSRAP